MNKTEKALRGDRCKCPSCGLLFNSTAAFDKHRTGSFKKGERRCLSITQMSEREMAVNQAGFWVTAKHPGWILP